jgi:hypothetical protein
MLMTPKKRQPSYRKTKYLESLKQQMQEHGPLDGKKVIIADTQGPKLSTVLMAFIEPYKELATTDEELEKLVVVAVIAWNAAILTGKERKALIRATVDAITKTAGKEWRKDTEDIIQMLVERKERYFADDKRVIVDYHLTATAKKYHLSVASVVKKRRQPP